MTARTISVAIAAAAVLAAAGPAHAHTMSDGHLELVPDAERLVGTIDVAVRDLHDAFGVDPDGDGRLTWHDLIQRKAEITAYVASHLSIATSDGPCPLATGELGVVDRPDGAHVAVALTATCAAPPIEVTVDYRLLYELDAQHRGLVHIGDGRAIARQDGGPLRLVVRTGLLPRLAAAVPGGGLTVVLGGAALALALAGFLLRRTSRLSVAIVVATAVAVAAPVGWALHRLVA